jgi:hypothetical protein
LAISTGTWPRVKKNNVNMIDDPTLKYLQKHDDDDKGGKEISVVS